MVFNAFNVFFNWFCASFSQWHPDPIVEKKKTPLSPQIKGKGEGEGKEK